jgi:hypothetical protein
LKLHLLAIVASPLFEHTSSGIELDIESSNHGDTSPCWLDEQLDPTFGELGIERRYGTEAEIRANQVTQVPSVRTQSNEALALPACCQHFAIGAKPHGTKHACWGVGLRRFGGHSNDGKSGH